MWSSGQSVLAGRGGEGGGVSCCIMKVSLLPLLLLALCCGTVVECSALTTFLLPLKDIPIH